jgi:hypothetical protein
MCGFRNWQPGRKKRFACHADDNAFPLKISRFPAQGSSSVTNLHIPDRAGNNLFTHGQAGFLAANAGLKER